MRHEFNLKESKEDKICGKITSAKPQKSTKGTKGFKAERLYSLL
jgi:hypothetical protein